MKTKYLAPLAIAFSGLAGALGASGCSPSYEDVQLPAISQQTREANADVKVDVNGNVAQYDTFSQELRDKFQRFSNDGILANYEQEDLLNETLNTPRIRNLEKILPTQYPLMTDEQRERMQKQIQENSGLRYLLNKNLKHVDMKTPELEKALEQKGINVKVEGIDTLEEQLTISTFALCLAISALGLANRK